MSTPDAALEIDREYGRALPTLGWVPAPRYLLRRAVILEWMSTAAPGSVLEVGAGAASLLGDLAAMRFEGIAVETSGDARALAARMLSDLPSVRIQSALPPVGSHSDYLFAFEVLEHITDDAAALREWVQRLRPGGRALLSVPAYAKKWTATDTWAGHVRRYDREDFVALAESAGLRVRRCVHYGFPLADAIEPVNAWVHARALSAAHSRDDRTSASGVRRTAETRLYPWMKSWPGRVGMRTAIRMQRWFSNSSLGNGLLLDAERVT